MKKRTATESAELYGICIYTIISPERLAEAAKEHKPLEERRRWVTGRALVRPGRQVPVIFADARYCKKLLAWSTLRRVWFTKAGTKFTLTTLYDVSGLKRRDLTVLSTEKPIPESHIRPYVLCKTPRLLKAPARLRGAS